MKISTNHSGQQGIAIIIVMISIAILAALAGNFAASMKVETRLALNSRNETELEWAGRSGIELTRYVLGEELAVPGPAQRYDALDQRWAGGSTETNEELLAVPFTDIELGPGARIKKWSLVDTERKFNVNMALASAPVLKNALIHVVGADAAEVPTIVSSIQDWIDADDNLSPDGAETEYYQSLSPPYSAKNGPIDDLSELLLIKGIADNPELYWGPNNPLNPSAKLSSRQVAKAAPLPGAPADPVGMVEVFTPISSGLINILTASPAQLQVLPFVDEALANQIVQMRSEVGDDGFLPYRSPSDLLVNTALGRELTPQVAPYCTFRSTTFEATVVVEVGQSTRTYFALLRRNGPRDVQILGLRWEQGDMSESPNKLD